MASKTWRNARWLLRLTSTSIIRQSAGMSDRPHDPARWSLALFAVLALLFLATPIYNAATRPDCQRNKDYTFWWEIGLDVRGGQPLYGLLPNGDVKYLYPPPLAVLLYAPLTHLGPVGLVLGLGLLTTAAWLAAIWASIVLLSGRWRGHPGYVYVLPGLAIATYVYDLQLLGQINLVLLALLLLSVLALRNGSRTGAAALFAAPVAMKAFPLPAIVYFLARREWMVAALSLLFMVAYLWFLPGLVRGFERNGAELREWTRNMLGDQSGNTTAARTGIGFTRRNHSLVSVSHRLLRDVDAGDNPRKALKVNVANIPPQAAQLIGMSAVVLLGCVLLASARLRFATSIRAEGLETAMICILVVLCSPLSHTYFYCWLLPAWIAVALEWRSSRAARIGGMTAGLLLLSSLSEQFDPTLQALGVTTWGSLSLYLALAWIRYRLPNTQPAASQVPAGVLRQAA